MNSLTTSCCSPHHLCCQSLSLLLLLEKDCSSHLLVSSCEAKKQSWIMNNFSVFQSSASLQHTQSGSIRVEKKLSGCEAHQHSFCNFVCCFVTTTHITIREEMLQCSWLLHSGTHLLVIFCPCSDGQPCTALLQLHVALPTALTTRLCHQMCKCVTTQFSEAAMFPEELVVPTVIGRHHHV